MNGRINDRPLPTYDACGASKDGTNPGRGKKAAERRLREIEQEVRAGIDPDCAEDELARINADIASKLARVEDLLGPFEALMRHA